MSQLKFNWGWGITLFMIGFVSFMGYLTYRAFGIDFDLVAEDYYAQELAYEGRLIEMRNASALSARPQLEVNDLMLSISFPQSYAAGSKGEIHFYDPSNRKNDRFIEIALDGEGQMHMPLDQFNAMYYKVKMSWENNGTPYFHELDFVLQQ